jgi:hypothetical protein
MGQTLFFHFTVKKSKAQARLMQLININYLPDDHCHQKRQEWFEDSTGRGCAPDFPQQPPRYVMRVFSGIVNKTQTFGIISR